MKLKKKSEGEKFNVFVLVLRHIEKICFDGKVFLKSNIRFVMQPLLNPTLCICTDCTSISWQEGVVEGRWVLLTVCPPSYSKWRIFAKNWREQKALYRLLEFIGCKQHISRGYTAHSSPVHCYSHLPYILASILYVQ